MFLGGYSKYLGNFVSDVLVNACAHQIVILKKNRLSFTYIVISAKKSFLQIAIYYFKTRNY